jgi:uncharacterized membrane protein
MVLCHILCLRKDARNLHTKTTDRLLKSGAKCVTIYSVSRQPYDGLSHQKGREAMPLFQKKENLSDEEKRLSVVTFWLFVVSVFAWVIPFVVIFILNLMTNPVGRAMGAAFLPSIVTFLVTAVLCAIVYFLYRKLIVRL